jgi:hypothetical protein
MIGLRELLIIGAVVLVLYGRSGVLKGQRAQTILPWLSPFRRTPPRARASTRTSAGPAAAIGRARRIPGAFLVRGNRVYWFLTILAATAVATLIIAKALISSGARGALGP